MLLGGLLIGLATSLPLAVGWHDAVRPPVGVCLFGTEENPFERIWFRGWVFPLPCLPTLLFVQPAVWGSFLGAGIVFGLLAHDLAGASSARGARLRLAALGGACLLILSILGTLVVSRIPGPALPLPFSSPAGVPFAVMVFGVSFVFALVLGIALRRRGWLWRAFLAAAVTALAYWLVIELFLGRAVMIWIHDAVAPPLAHSLPLLGNGMGPMMKTVLIGNLVAGTIGGWLTLGLLTSRGSATRERREGQDLVAENAGVDD